MSEEVPGSADTQQGARSSSPPRQLAKNFRWQAFFQRCAEPLFVLDRRRRLLFVNAAWETLTGIAREQAQLLVCRRQRPTSTDDSSEDILAHALTPPTEVLRGASARVRRLLPGPSARWWEVEFLPLLQQGEQGGHLILGRIRPLPAAELPRVQPFSEKLVNLRQQRVERFGLDAWASTLPAMRRLLAQARLAGQTTTPVLIVGEPGTGKQTLARTIHYLSPRGHTACAVLDCRHVPPAALAALLFGQDRREPTSLGRETLGAIYLREPEYLPRDVQLLLCERLARGNEPSAETTGGPRLFAGCTMPLLQAVRTGRLLEELACALGTLVLEIPPLRERRADLAGLVERLLARACLGREQRVSSLSEDAWAVLRSYAWPQNVRELYDVLRTACMHTSGEQLRAADLPAELRRAVERDQLPPRLLDRALPLEQLLEEAERRLIQLALQRARGQKARAARLLGIPRPRLWRRMLKLGIADPENESGAPADDPEEK